MSDRVSKELSTSTESLSKSRECFVEVYINNWCLIIIVYLQSGKGLYCATLCSWTFSFKFLPKVKVFVSEFCLLYILGQWKLIPGSGDMKSEQHSANKSPLRIGSCIIIYKSNQEAKRRSLGLDRQSVLIKREAQALLI